MYKTKNIITLAAGILAGVLLTTTTGAAVDYVKARLSDQPIYLDGERIECRTYNIADQNYIRLVDLCDALGVDWHWDSATNSVYLGEQPQPAAAETVTLPTDGSKFIPHVGDKVLCDDGYIYEITDVSRWENNVFAPGPLPELPSPTCDWSRFPEVELPELAVRHFSDAYGETMFIRNLYEMRRMQYVIYNALGEEPSAWKNGQLLGSVTLTIPDEYESITKTFWPWRETEVTKHVHNIPAAHFYVEAWDYYRNGIFQYTRYCLVTR